MPTAPPQARTDRRRRRQPRQILVPTVIEEGSRGDRAFDIYSQLLRERIVFLGQEVDDQVANLIISQMLFLEAADNEKDIHLYINSPGGHGLRRHGHLRRDAARGPRRLHHLRGHGHVGGRHDPLRRRAGKRFALPNSRIMIHQGSAGTRGAPSDMEIQLREVLALTHRMAEIIAHHCGPPGRAGRPRHRPRPLPDRRGGAGLRPDRRHHPAPARPVGRRHSRWPLVNPGRHAGWSPGPAPPTPGGPASHGPSAARKVGDTSVRKRLGTREDRAMQAEDLILVSVDDHVIEPRGMFDGLLPAKYQDLAPQLIRRPDGTDYWHYHGQEIPNVGLNAVVGRPPEEYGIEPTSLDDMRPGCYDIHERVRDMSANGVLGSMCFPSFPQFCGQLFARREDKDEALAMVQAYNDWHIEQWCGAEPGRFIPLSIPIIWDPELMAAEVRRVAKMGCHAVTFSENPEKLGLALAAQQPLGPVLAGLLRRGHDHLHAPGLLVAAAHHLGRGTHRRHDQPAADQHGAGRRRPAVVPHPAQVQGPPLRPLRGRHRLDPLRPRAHRLRLRAPPQVDRARTSATCCPARSSRSASSPASSTTPSASTTAATSTSTTSPGSATTRTRTPPGPQSPEAAMKYLADVPDDEIDKITHLNAMKHFQYDPFSVRPREKCTVARAAGRDRRRRHRAEVAAAWGSRSASRVRSSTWGPCPRCSTATERGPPDVYRLRHR